MPMTTEQFERFLEAVIDNRKTGERLATIEALIRAGNESSEKFRIEVAKDIRKANDSASAAHKRIDTLLIMGGITVLLTLAGLFASMYLGQ